MELYHLFLVSVSIGLGNFAASIGIGMGGVDNRLRLKIAIIFGFFEGFMPVLGLLAGLEVSKFIGRFGNYVGAVLLILSGLYTLWQVRKRSSEQFKEERARIYQLKLRRLILMGFVLGIDNLVVGFALSLYHVPLPVTAIFIATVSILMSLIGLEMGKYLGERFEEWSEVAGSLILIFVGLGLAFGIL